MIANTLPPGLIPVHIAPVPEAVQRPVWSVMIPTYNCAKYLSRTLESVLAQDPGPAQMHIEVIDDCSTNDDPEAVVRAIGKGRVSFYRKGENEGAIANFNTCVQRSYGHLVHILHGDDWSENGFYQAAERVFREDSDIGICIARAFVVDETGAIDSLTPRIAVLESGSNNADFMFYENPVRTPGVVVKRSLYEEHGGFLGDLVHTADWEMWIRMIDRSKGIFLNQPLVSYRFFPGNDTGRLARTGENMRDYLRLGIVLDRNFPLFSRKTFERLILANIRSQIDRFHRLADAQAEKANRTLYREVISQQSLALKFRESIVMSLVGLERSMRRIIS